MLECDKQEAGMTPILVFPFPSRAVFSKEVLSMPEGVIEPAQPTLRAAERQSSPGIIVFSSTFRVLYSNEAAHDFLKRLSHEERRETTDCSLPLVIVRILNQMRQALERRPMQGGERRMDMGRLVVGRDRPVLLQAFGLSDRVDPHRSRIVVRMGDITTSVAARPCAPASPAA